jgi:hypothetical protein
MLWRKYIRICHACDAFRIGYHSALIGVVL